MVRANRSEGKSWCGIIKYHELNQRCNELRNRVAPRSGKLGTARRLQVDTGRGHSQNPPWLGSKACDCDLIRKTTRGSDFTHFEAFSLQYIETIPWYKTIVWEFGRLFLLLKADFRQFNLFSYVTLPIISTLLMITEQKSHPAIPTRWSTVRYSIVVAQS